MYTETEAKLKVDCLVETERRLVELNAEFVSEQVQTDHYFDDEDSQMTKSDKCLRLRRVATDKGEGFFLTFKGARRKNRFKERQEIEIQIKQPDAARELLSALGYKEMLVFEKKRRIWHLGGCEIALDQLPLLGDFVEIEGPDAEAIARAQRDLQLTNSRHIPESYAALVEEKLCRRGAGT